MVLMGDGNGSEPQGLTGGARRRRQRAGARRSMSGSALISTIVRSFGSRIGRILAQLLTGLFRR
jgi:hypothetical protein